MCLYTVKQNLAVFWGLLDRYQHFQARPYTTLWQSVWTAQCLSGHGHLWKWLMRSSLWFSLGCRHGCNGFHGGYCSVCLTITFPWCILSNRSRTLLAANPSLIFSWMFNLYWTPCLILAKSRRETKLTQWFRKREEPAKNVWEKCVRKRIASHVTIVLFM